MIANTTMQVKRYDLYHPGLKQNILTDVSWETVMVTRRIYRQMGVRLVWKHAEVRS